MVSHKRIAWLVALIVSSGPAGIAMAANNYTEAPAGSYLKGCAEMSKAGAAWVSAQAAVIKAKADATVSHAKAIQTMEQTRTVSLDNDLKAATNFYEKRKLNEAYRMVNTQARPTKEDLIRYSKASMPERPTNYQVDQVRGTIRWLEVFQQDEFLAHRVPLDYLFAQRSPANSGLGSENCRQVKQEAEGMREVLRSIIGEMSPAEYLAARKFIESLAFEAQFAPRMEGVAAYQFGRHGLKQMTD